MNLDPRFIRTNLQDRQAAHRLSKEHGVDLAGAARPDLIGHLLCRAADLLRPTGPAPFISPEIEGDQECP